MTGVGFEPTTSDCSASTATAPSCIIYIRVPEGKESEKKKNRRDRELFRDEELSALTADVIEGHACLFQVFKFFII